MAKSLEYSEMVEAGCENTADAGDRGGSLIGEENNASKKLRYQRDRGAGEVVSVKSWYYRGGYNTEKVRVLKRLED